MTKQRIAILGATTYGGRQPPRLLLAHPAADVRYVTSRSEAGTSVGKIHRNLDGICDLKFSNPDVETLIQECDVIFGALPHGASAEVLAPFVKAGIPPSTSQATNRCVPAMLTSAGINARTHTQRSLSKRWTGAQARQRRREGKKVGQ